MAQNAECRNGLNDTNVNAPWMLAYAIHSTLNVPKCELSDVGHWILVVLVGVGP